MANNPKYYIVEASALPEVFLKVAEAKRLLSTGEAATVNEATKLTGISRSAFYKYRDAVLPFQNMMIGRIITFQLLLQDETGILSTLLNLFAEVNANITTINSIVPTNGCAVVTISAETMDLTVHIEELLRLIRKTPGVIKAEVLAGSLHTAWEEQRLLPFLWYYTECRGGHWPSVTAKAKLRKRTSSAHPYKDHMVILSFSWKFYTGKPVA